MDTDSKAIGEDAIKVKKRTWALIRDGVILLGVSTLLYFLNITIVVFVSPLLIYSVLSNKRGSVILISIETLIVVVSEILSNISLLNLGPVGWVLVSLILFVPLSLLAAGLVWLGTERFNSVKRVVLSILPSLLFISVYLVLFIADRALFLEVYSHLENAFAESIVPLLSMVFNRVNTAVVFRAFLMTILSLILPILLSAVCATFFIYESARHSKEISYDDRVADFELNINFIWIFILSWALLLVFYFISAPVVLEVLTINIALSSLFVYMAEGFTVLYSWIRKRVPRLRSMTLFIIVFLVCMLIPGLNIVILLVLPILGLLENFFDLKKKGARNEDNP